MRARSKPRKRNLPPNRSVSCSGPAFRVCWFRSPWLPGGRPLREVAAGSRADRSSPHILSGLGTLRQFFSRRQAGGVCPGSNVRLQRSLSKEGVLKQNADIYIKQVGVEAPFRLTDHPAPDLSPAWSPDGQSIAFARQLPSGRVAYIVKPQRGGPERTVAEFTGPKGGVGMEPFRWASPSCTWTADSQRLVVVGMNAERPILFLVVLQSGEKRHLTDPPAGLGDGDPAISPDGRDLVFSRMESGGRGALWRLSLAEDLTPLGKPERLAVDSPFNREPAWMPEGSEIVYTGGAGGLGPAFLDCHSRAQPDPCVWQLPGMHRLFPDKATGWSMKFGE